MRYYIILSERKEDLWDTNTIGEESFGTFYTGLGYIALHNLFSQEQELKSAG